MIRDHKTRSLALLSLLTLLQVQPSTAQTTASPALQRASCVLRMEGGERFGPAASSAQTLVAALTSTALIDPAMEAALKLPASEWPSVAQVEVQPAGEAAVKMTVTLKPAGNFAPTPGAAKLALDEITSRALRSFNGNEQGDDPSEAVARLRQQRVDLDGRLNALRVEADAAMQFANRRDSGNRLVVQGQIEQQIAEARIEGVVQAAAIKAINEQLPSIEKETDAEMRTLRARFIGQRIDAEIAAAKAEARLAELQKRLSELKSDLATSQPARSAMTIQSEQAEVMNQRQLLDQQINQMMSEHNNRPSKGKLIVMDGGAK